MRDIQTRYFGCPSCNSLHQVESLKSRLADAEGHIVELTSEVCMLPCHHYEV
jgi:transcription elongation factor Elf1